MLWICGKLVQAVIVFVSLYFFYLFILDMYEFSKQKKVPSLFDNDNFEPPVPPMKKPKDDYQKFNVRLNQDDVEVYFYLSDKKTDVGWGGSKKITYTGRLKDEATLDSDFYIFIHELNGNLSAVPCGFDERKTTSILQKIVINNEESVGNKLIKNIFSQIKSKLEN